MKKIAVIIPNYNYSEYIEDAIMSVIRSYVDNALQVQIVVIDDKSTDDSMDKLMRHVNKKPVAENNILTLYTDTEPDDSRDAFVSVIQLKQNGGPSRARNVGIDYIISSFKDVELFLMLDADDIIKPDKIDKMEKRFHDPNVGVVYADYEILNDDGSISVEYKEPFDLKRLFNECIVHSGSMVSKKALLATRDKYGYYDVSMRTCEDYDLWLRIAQKFMILHIPEVLTTVRNHKNNSTNTVSKSVWNANWQRIRDKLNGNT